MRKQEGIREERYSYDDMVKAILEERERIINIFQKRKDGWPWSLGARLALPGIVKQEIRAASPTPASISMAREQEEDEGLMVELQCAGGRIIEEEAELEEERQRALAYESDGDGRIDDHTSVWGRMGGPDCCIVPA